MFKSISVNLETQSVSITDDNDKVRALPLSSPDAFDLISKAWLRCGWDVKHVYSFSWLGRPIIQLPEDILRLQEIIYRVKPDVIIETGIAHGGSLILHASICKCIGRGRVIGVDIEIRPHNLEAIQNHELFSLITLIEGDSVSAETIGRVRAHIRPDEKVLVILDSCHTKSHVLAELNAYSPLVSVGSYIVVMDGIMKDLVGAPRTAEDWGWNNPHSAVREFLDLNANFKTEPPSFVFNEGQTERWVSYAPDGLLLKTSEKAVCVL
jgi:cephalosporin hydroxylase